MPLTTVENALAIVRTHLVECSARDDADKDSTEELAQIIACLRRDAAEAWRKGLGAEPLFTREVLRQSVRFVHANLGSKLTWADMAAALGLDPFRFGRGFKLATGMTPHQYIIRCRIRRAMRLLARDDLALADIALEVGCSCQSHLNTLFRKHLGITPGAFRESLRIQPERG